MNLETHIQRTFTPRVFGIKIYEEQLINIVNNIYVELPACINLMKADLLH